MSQTPSQSPAQKALVQRRSEALNARLVALLNGPSTRTALGLTPYLVDKLITDGVITAVEGKFQKATDAETGAVKAGRPAQVYKATSNGRKRLQRFAKRQTPVDTEQA